MSGSNGIIVRRLKKRDQSRGVNSAQSGSLCFVGRIFISRCIFFKLGFPAWWLRLQKCRFSCSKRLIQVHFKPLQAFQTKQLHLKGKTCSFYADLRRGEVRLPSEKSPHLRFQLLNCMSSKSVTSSVERTLDRGGRRFGWGSEGSRLSCVDWKDHRWTERMDASYHLLKEQGFVFFLGCIKKHAYVEWA